MSATMSGHELTAMRLRLGLGWVEFARMLGYAGSGKTLRRMMFRIERGGAMLPLPDEFGRRLRAWQAAQATNKVTAK